MAQHSGDLWWSARIAAHVFIAGRWSYSVCPALDVHVRYAASRWLAPFISAYGEYRFGARPYDLAYPDA